MYSEASMLGPRPSVAICIACFFGQRERYWEDSDVEMPALSHVLRQMRYLDEYTVKANRISFVVNVDVSGSPEDASARAAQQEALDAFVSIVEKKNAEDSGRNWEVLSRPNENISYGAWKWYLDNHCKGFDYVYLLEDDYSPTFKGYDLEVINKVFDTEEARNSIVKACSLYVDHTLSESDRVKGSKSLREGVPHAAVSNGVVNMRVYREVPGGLNVPTAQDLAAYNPFLPEKVRKRRRRAASSLQATYLHSYTQHPSGLFRCVNLGQYYSVPFIETVNSEVMYFGKDGAPVLFSPTELLDL